jgi:hypothetical protein
MLQMNGDLERICLREPLDSTGALEQRDRRLAHA